MELPIADNDNPVVMMVMMMAMVVVMPVMDHNKGVCLHQRRKINANRSQEHERYQFFHNNTGFSINDLHLIGCCFDGIDLIVIICRTFGIGAMAQSDRKHSRRQE